MRDFDVPNSRTQAGPDPSVEASHNGTATPLRGSQLESWASCSRALRSLRSFDLGWLFRAKADARV